MPRHSPDPADVAASDPRLDRWLVGLGVAVAAADMVRVYSSRVVQGRPSTWFHAFASTAPFWITLGLLLPLVVRLALRFPFERGRWRSSLAVHLAGLAGFVVLHPVVGGLLADAVVLATEPEWMPEPLRDRPLSQLLPLMVRNHLRKVWGFHPLVELSAYAATVAATAAVRAHLRSVAQERAAARALARAAQLEASLTRARLETLRMQLNPHFLFNALNAASVLALKGESDKVVAMLARLSELLRLVLESSEQVVRLVDEVALLDRYLEVERVRFEDRLTVAVEIDPEVLDAEVPSLVLQPLAENAIRHGISRRPGPGRLEVRARAVGGRLEIELADSGPGFLAAGEGGSRGVGLANTRERLAQLYGAEAALELGDAPDGGGVVRLVLPLRTFAGAGEGRPRADDPRTDEEAVDAETIRG